MSDNGSPFTANNTQQFVANHNIQWKFSIAEAPWYGGFWERLISQVKRCLKKTLGKTSLDFYELQTVLSQVELILNSRPLGVLFDDVLEQILTPNHLLFGRKLNLVNSSSTHPVKEIDISPHYKYVECLLEHFWERWRTKYIPSLREFQKAYHKTNNIIPQVGGTQYVNIFEDKQPRQKWLLGRIIELVSTKENLVRGAKIYIGKTKRVIERPTD